jgi:hypothetical protein
MELKSIFLLYRGNFFFINKKDAQHALCLYGKKIAAQKSKNFIVMCTDLQSLKWIGPPPFWDFYPLSNFNGEYPSTPLKSTLCTILWSFGGRPGLLLYADISSVNK